MANPQGNIENLKRGNTVNVGRKPNHVRLNCAEGFAEGLTWLRQLASGEATGTNRERMEAMKILGQYGGIAPKRDETSPGEKPLLVVDI